MAAQRMGNGTMAERPGGLRMTGDSLQAAGAVETVECERAGRARLSGLERCSEMRREAGKKIGGLGNKTSGRLVSVPGVPVLVGGECGASSWW